MDMTKKLTYLDKLLSNKLFVIILSQNKGGQITKAPPTVFQNLNNPPIK